MTVANHCNDSKNHCDESGEGKQKGGKMVIYFSVISFLRKMTVICNPKYKTL